MALISKKVMKMALCLGALQFASAAPAQALGLGMVSGQVAGIIQMLISPNLCITYTYDLNGNRTAQSNVTYGSPGAVWGSAVYACFDWTSP
jgi:hypothetical protein